MMLKNYLLLFCLSLVMMGCVEKESALKNQDFQKLSVFIYEKGNFKFNPCGKSWAYPEKSNATVKQECETASFKLATKLSENGFGDITSQDIHHAEFWLFFEKYRAEQRANKKPFEMPKW